MIASAVGFLDLLEIRQIGWAKNRAVWMTCTPLRYQSPKFGMILIPAEFITDLASVPRLPLVYLMAGGRGNRSAVIHDFPYQFGYWLDWEGRQILVEKSITDTVFHESLLLDPMSGADRAIAWQMWAGVALIGRGAWADRPERVHALNPIWEAEWGVGPLETI